MFKFSLSGQSDLAKRLDALPGAVAMPILQRALKKAAEPIRARAAALAPRSSPDGGRPGHLADHIGVSLTRKVDGEAIGDGQAAVAIGPTKDYFWAIVQEYGPHDGRYSAQPFMRPAFDGGAENAVKAIIDELWAELRKAAESGVGASFGGSIASGTGTL